MIIEKQFSFHSAHKLWNESWSEEQNREVFGKCACLHGHSYTLKVGIYGQPDETGMILNFRDLKRIVNEHVIDRFDHVFLNELPEFAQKQTTCEAIAATIFETLQPLLKGDNYNLYEVRVSETKSSEAIVRASY